MFRLNTLLLFSALAIVVSIDNKYEATRKLQIPQNVIIDKGVVVGESEMPVYQTRPVNQNANTKKTVLSTNDLILQRERSRDTYLRVKQEEDLSNQHIRRATGGIIYTLIMMLTLFAFLGNGAFLVYVFWLSK